MSRLLTCSARVRGSLLVMAVIGAALLGGCSAVPASPSLHPVQLAYPIVVLNGTDVAITVMFAGSEFATVSANSSITIPTANVPPVPFELEAQLPSGQAIATRQVTSPGYFLVRVGLTCGVLDIWSASTQPLGPRPDPSNDIHC